MVLYYSLSLLNQNFYSGVIRGQRSPMNSKCKNTNLAHASNNKIRSYGTDLQLESGAQETLTMTNY